MLFFLYFFIGHLLGDFLFQTSKMVAWKQRSLWGVSFHVAIVTLAMFFVLSPYLHSSWIWGAIILNSILHFFTDQGKILYENTYKPKNPIIPFWIDQAVHVLTFTGISFFIPQNISPYFFTNTWWIEYYQQQHFLIYFLGFLFFSYALDIVYFIYRLKEGDRTPYARSYYSMLVHIFLFVCLFFVFWFLARFYFDIF